MMNIYILAAILFAFGFLAKMLVQKTSAETKTDTPPKPPYTYTLKPSFMTPAEHVFFNSLTQAVGDIYYVFPQAHLSTLFDEKVKGHGWQNWRAARSHIEKKSVDFVLCDKIHLSPKMAIELDDPTHEREDRQVRDAIVEELFHDAGLPLLRIKNGRDMSPADIATHIQNTPIPHTAPGPSQGSMV